MPGFLVFYIKRNTTDTHKQYFFQIYTIVSAAKRSWHLNILFSLFINLIKDGLDLVPHEGTLGHV